MKRQMIWVTCAGFFLSLAFISFRGAYAQVPHHAGSSNDRVPAGYHEFEMFGAQSIYLSHYPMFGSIHAYQVILEVNVKSTDGSNPKDIYLSHKQKNPKARYSVSPETADGEPHYWVLPETIHEGNAFRANIHLERKAGPPVYLARNVTVEIKRVVHFRLFQPDDKKPEVLTYLLFGNDAETFMAHYIGNFPDFDQILSVKINAKSPPFNEHEPMTLVTIPSRDNEKSHRLGVKDTTVVGRINGKGVEWQIDVDTEIHSELDLEIQR